MLGIVKYTYHKCLGGCDGLINRNMEDVGLYFKHVIIMSCLDAV